MCLPLMPPFFNIFTFILFCFSVWLIVSLIEKIRVSPVLHQGRIIFVVGDLNIAPFAIDRCDARLDFDKNE
jgi:hypothetical protein